MQFDDGAFMKISELIKSREYIDAKAKIQAWRARLGKSDAAEALRVRDEKAAFFSLMRKDRPDLYAAFQINDKSLSEAIHKALSGKEIIID